MVEILKDNLVSEAGPVYEAMDMDWVKLVGQISAVYAKKYSGRVQTVDALSDHQK
jgi:hypothetical protein